jgi:hypothetical protein
VWPAGFLDEPGNLSIGIMEHVSRLRLTWLPPPPLNRAQRRPPTQARQSRPGSEMYLCDRPNSRVPRRLDSQRRGPVA